MRIAYRVTPRLVRELKKPLGMLIAGSPQETIGKLRIMMRNRRAPILITVGDEVTQNIVAANLAPKLAVVDSKRMRTPMNAPVLPEAIIIRVDNARGTITDEAVTAIEKGLAWEGPVEIIVAGEEDLLTLVAVLSAPDGSFVVYGQPREGIVVIAVDPKKKSEVAQILTEMEIRSKD